MKRMMVCYVMSISEFIQASLRKIQGLFKALKDFPTFLKDNKLMTNSDLHVKILLHNARLR